VGLLIRLLIKKKSALWGSWWRFLCEYVVSPSLDWRMRLGARQHGRIGSGGGICGAICGNLLCSGRTFGL